MKKPFALLLSKACLLLLFALTTKESLATNYYVKIGGSDAAAGTDWATAFADRARGNASWERPGKQSLFEPHWD